MHTFHFVYDTHIYNYTMAKLNYPKIFITMLSVIIICITCTNRKECTSISKKNNICITDRE